MKKCQFCAEEIQDEAIKCKHCQSLTKKEKLIVLDRKVIIWVLVILAFLIFLIVREASVQKTPPVATLKTLNPVSFSVSELQLVSDEANKALPKNINKSTILTKTYISDGRFVFSYKLLTEKGEEKYTQSDLDNILKSGAVKGACLIQSTRNILNSGAYMIFEYYDNNDTFIGKITMKASDCD